MFDISLRFKVGLCPTDAGILMKNKLLIVDDHAVIREGLAFLINNQPDFEVVGEAGTVTDAVTKAVALRPDLVLMDVGLPDGTGMEATKSILAQCPEINIIMLTIHDADEILLEAIRSGAKGYLMKNTTARNLIDSLRALTRGEVAISTEMTGRIMEELANEKKSLREESTVIDQLTTRELEILGEISNGATNKEIAERLFISVNTVKNHVHEILEKLEVKNRREAGLLAIRHGLKKNLLQ